VDDFELELKQDFLTEAAELMANVEGAFLRLETEREDTELIDEIFRLAHNLKGTSKAVGFDSLSELTHIAESLVLKVKEGEVKIDNTVVNALLEFKDCVSQAIEDLSQNVEANISIEAVSELLTAAQIPQEEPAQTLESQSEDIAQGEDFEANVRTDRAEDGGIEHDGESVNTLDDEYQNALAQSAELASFDDSQFVDMDQDSVPVPQEASAVPETIEKPKEIGNQNAQKRSSPRAIEETIRVKLSRIDLLNNIVGELVIIQNVLAQRRFEFIKDELSVQSITQMAKLFKEVQHLAMSFRMVPLRTTFQKMNRIVRDTSKLLNKKVKLNLVGEDTEVDKTVLEKISDPLVHIIRNSVDHAIESPEKREEIGKNPEGLVQLEASHQGNHLVIRIIDDGAGIDSKAILKKAIEKGIVGQNEGITESAALQLLFHPGFSTKEQVTEVSGRGVGLDVVKKNIEALGGEVRLTSKLGKGSVFEISLPLTLAIIDGIVVRCKQDQFVVPLGQVYEMVTIEKKDISKFSNGGEFILLRGEVIPVFDLGEKLHKKLESPQKRIAILVNSEHYTYGVLVDDVTNQQQIVIKPIGDEIRNQKGIMGSAIMGNGRPSFILDLVELFKGDFQKNRQFRGRNNTHHLVSKIGEQNV